LILFGKPAICSDNSQKTQDAGRLFQMQSADKKAGGVRVGDVMVQAWKEKRLVPW
jgi:hypothetical protein